MEYLIKIIVSALIIATVSELGKRSTSAAAILASLPLTSILAMLWLWRDTHDAHRLSALSTGILWAVLPSLLFFVLISQLLDRGVRFPWAMAASCTGMFAAYSAYVYLLGRLGIRF